MTKKNKARRARLVEERRPDQLAGGIDSDLSEDEAESNPFEIASEVASGSHKVNRRDDTMNFLGSGDEGSQKESQAKSGKSTRGRRRA